MSGWMIFGIVYAIGAIVTLILTGVVMAAEASGTTDNGEPGDEMIILFASALLWPLALILHIFHFVEFVSSRREYAKATDKVRVGGSK
jgi:hypothetical protein